MVVFNRQSDTIAFLTYNSRLMQLENELASLRSQGVDLTKKNREIEVARQRAQETATRAKEAARYVLDMIGIQMCVLAYNSHCAILLLVTESALF